MDSKKTKLLNYCIKNYPRNIFILFFLCLIINIIIVIYEENPELIPFGHELGKILLPLASSFIGGIIFHFFTSHWNEMNIKITSYKNLDFYFRGYRRAIKHTCWSLSENKNEIDKFSFYEIDLKNSIEISRSLLEKDNNIILEIKSGIKGNYFGTLGDLKNQLYNELILRYRFENLDLNYKVKEYYQDICVTFEEFLKIEFDSRESAAKNFNKVLPTLIGLLSEANHRLSEDNDFLEVVSSFYSNPAKFGDKSPSQIKLKTNIQ